jgi:hypothetical protein
LKKLVGFLRNAFVPELTTGGEPDAACRQAQK